MQLNKSVITSTRIILNLSGNYCTPGLQQKIQSVSVDKSDQIRSDQRAAKAAGFQQPPGSAKVIVTLKLDLYSSLSLFQRSGAS